MENAADVNPYILGLPDTLIPAAKRAQKRASALTDVTSTRNSAKLKPREAPKAQFSSANATFYAAGKTGQIYLLYIEKEGFWTLTPNLQQMHESLREYHQLVIRGEKKNKQSFLAASTGGRKVGFSSDVGAPALYQPLQKLEYPSLLAVQQLTLFSVA